jgi:hypothetical protein
MVLLRWGSIRQQPTDRVPEPKVQPAQLRQPRTAQEHMTIGIKTLPGDAGIIAIGQQIPQIQVNLANPFGSAAMLTGDLVDRALDEDHVPAIRTLAGKTGRFPASFFSS